MSTASRIPSVPLVGPSSPVCSEHLEVMPRTVRVSAAAPLHDLSTVSTVTILPSVCCLNWNMITCVMAGGITAMSTL